MIAKESTLRKFGGLLGITLPKSMTDHFNLSAGDNVFVIESELGILLTPYDPNVLRVMEAEDRISQQYLHALRKLAH